MLVKALRNLAGFEIFKLTINVALKYKYSFIIKNIYFFGSKTII